MTSGGACMRLRCWVKRSLRLKIAPFGCVAGEEGEEEEGDSGRGWAFAQVPSVQTQ